MGYQFGGYPFDNREQWLRAICATHLTGSGKHMREELAQLFVDYDEEELADQVLQKWPPSELEGDGADEPYTRDELARVMVDLRSEFPDWYDND